MEVEEILLQQVRDLALQVTDVGKNVAGLAAKLQQKDVQCQKDRDDRNKMLDLLQTQFERLRAVETDLQLLNKAVDDIGGMEKELKKLTNRVQIMETQDSTKEKVEEKQEEKQKMHWSVFVTLIGWGGAVIVWVYETLLKR